MDIAMPARMMRLWTTRTRIACFLAVIMPFAVFARTLLVPTQPVSPYLDTEVSTNCVLHRSRIDARTFDVHFQFDGTPTNSLEVAFGRDSNTNGVLDVQEIDTVYGWRGGRYFIENALTCESFDSDAIAGSQNLSVELHLDIRSSPQQVRRIAVAGVNASAFAGILSERPPAWLWRREWNMMCMTRRGTEPLSDWLYYKASNLGFAIRLR